MKDRHFSLGRISCTQILHLMVILGCMFNYMLRTSLTVAIVEMVFVESEIYPNDTTISFRVPENKFAWTKFQQNLILGSFFWGCILTEMPSGRLSEVIGARKVFGGSMISASVLTLLTPAACRLGFITVIVFRCALGLFLGTALPTIPTLAVKWIPPTKRSKFMANMLSNSLGSAITMPACGLFILNWGWESVFYITGAIGLVYSISWFYLIYDSPADHPRITSEEQQEIESKIKDENGFVGAKPKKVPWKAMLTSVPVLAFIITHGLTLFGYFLIVNELPTYMKEVLHFNLKTNGLLSSLPYLAKYAMAVLSGLIADRIRKKGKLSTTAIRKLFTAIANLVPALLMIALATLGNNPAIAVSAFTCILLFNGAIAAGYMSSNLDIAPNFSGTIFGIAATVSSTGAFVSTLIVGVLTPSKTFEEWSYVFWIHVVTYTLGALTFLIFGSGELQTWNNQHSIIIIKEPQESQPLQIHSSK